MHTHWILNPLLIVQGIAAWDGMEYLSIIRDANVLGGIQDSLEVIGANQAVVAWYSYYSMAVH